MLIKNADSLSHPRPTDFGFLGLGHRNLYFEQIPVPTNVSEKTLLNCLSANLSYEDVNLMFQISFLWVSFWKWYFILKMKEKDYLDARI